MLVRYIQANTKVQNHIGETALAYGPMVYCLEEIDNGPDLQELILNLKGDVEIIRGDQEMRIWLRYQ